jgi:hypothetical protein
MYQAVNAYWAVDALIWKFGHQNLPQGEGRRGPALAGGVAGQPTADSLAPPDDELLGPSGPAAARFDDGRVELHVARPAPSSQPAAGAL